MKQLKKLNLEIKLYFFGVVLFMIGLIIPLPTQFKTIIYMIAILISGFHVMWEGLSDTVTNSLSRKKFLPNTHILMTIAALGAIFIGEAIEAALLIFIFAGAHFLEEYVESKSQKEIKALLELNPTEARKIMSDGSIALVAVESLKVGDQLQVLNGAQVPTDGVITEGQASINESSINGESIPREKRIGDTVFGSTINGNTSFTMNVTKDSKDTVFAKIIRLVESSQGNLSPTASFIERFEPIYVTTVLIIFVLLLLLGPNLFGWTLMGTLTKGLIFMVSASPCALAVSAIPATLAGISNLAKEGILFKGGAFLSSLEDVKAIAFDKTGTLTAGKPRVVDYDLEPSQVSTAVLMTIILGMEQQSNHPLAQAICSYFSEKVKPVMVIKTENKLGEGLTADYQGALYQIAKPSIFDNVPQKWLSAKETQESKGATVVFVAIDHQVCGYIAIQDKPQESAHILLDYLRKNQIKSVMITGDSEKTGKALASQMGMDDVKANVLPEEKSNLIQRLQKAGGLTAMVGDGVNDAPALAKADIGIAMGDGSDVAIETADIVIMKNDLSKLIIAHKLSKSLKQIIIQNVALSMIVVLLLVIFTFFSNLTVVQSVSLHEGSTLLVLINSLRLLRK